MKLIYMFIRGKSVNRKAHLARALNMFRGPELTEIYIFFVKSPFLLGVVIPLGFGSVNWIHSKRNAKSYGGI